MATPNEVEEMLAILRNVWNANPELRLCQLLDNAASLGKYAAPDLFYLEDEALKKHLKHYAKVMKKKQDDLKYKDTRW